MFCLVRAHDWDLNAAHCFGMCRIQLSLLFLLSLSLNLYIFFFLRVFCSFAFVSIIFLLAELNEPSTNDCFNIRTAHTHTLGDAERCVLGVGLMHLKWQSSSAKQSTEKGKE